VRGGQPERVTQAILLGIMMLTTMRPRRVEHRLLAALVLTIGTMIGLFLVARSPFAVRLPHLIRVNHPLDFLPAPLFYLYVRTLTERSRMRRRDLLHALPAVACVLYLLPYYARSAEYKLADVRSSGYADWYFLRAAAAILIATPYVVLGIVRAVRSVRRHRDRGANPHSVRQLEFLSSGFGILLAIAAARYLVDVSFPAYMPFTNQLLPLAGTAMLCGMAYLGLRDSAVLAGDTGEMTPSPRRYETSSLTDDRAGRALPALMHALDVEKVYLDPHLALSGLAARIGVPAPHLSQIINQRLNQNFPDLINSYRVAEARRRLVDPAWRHYSIMAIAEDVGFRSKSSFNSVFKKLTGMTPSEFRTTHASPDS
jgi:AraC-like DNA-binding protein